MFLSRIFLIIQFMTTEVYVDKIEFQASYFQWRMFFFDERIHLCCWWKENIDLFQREENASPIHIVGISEKKSNRLETVRYQHHKSIWLLCLPNTDLTDIKSLSLTSEEILYCLLLKWKSNSFVYDIDNKVCRFLIDYVRVLASQVNVKLDIQVYSWYIFLIKLTINCSDKEGDAPAHCSLTFLLFVCIWGTTKQMVFDS